MILPWGVLFIVLWDAKCITKQSDYAIYSWSLIVFFVAIFVIVSYYARQ